MKTRVLPERTKEIRMKNLPDNEYLAVARARLADWPDPDIRFGGSSTGIEVKPIVAPPGTQLVEEPVTRFSKRNAERAEALQALAERAYSEVCSKNPTGSHIWRKANAKYYGADAKYCRKCSVRRAFHAGDVLEEPRDPNACPKNNGGPHSWRPRNSCELGRLVQVNLCGKCKTRRQVAEVAA